MVWQSLATVALDVDSDIPSARAQAITEALCRRIVALLVRRDGRYEPLASGCLYWSNGHLILLTCRHVFDGGASLGDLALPLGESGRVVLLLALKARLLEQSGHDVAVIALCPQRAREALQRHWFPVPLHAAIAPDEPGTVTHLVVAGYPYAQMRRVDGIVYARPLVFFARALGASALAMLASYARTVRRFDGALVHAPALDGLSGATLWSIDDTRAGVDCILRPAGVQSSFKHDEYVRGAPIAPARALLTQLAAP